MFSEIVVDVAVDVLVPGEIADILNNQIPRSQLVLNAKAELGNCRRLVVLGESCASLREEGVAAAAPVT